MSPRPLRVATTRNPLSARRPGHRVLAALAGGALAASALLAPNATAAPPSPPRPTPVKADAVTGDVRELGQGKTFSTGQLSLHHPSGKQRRAAAAKGTPKVGSTRSLPALDDEQGVLYTKDYTLQAVGSNIEVWVADDTAFPAGDCRNQVAGSTTVTRAQAEALAEEFDSTILPVESRAFSVAPDRDGSAGTIDGVDATGDGDKVMTLVDNVRDDNFYDFPARTAYIGGFFSAQLDALLDRNAMTIDAFDWAHRTGANPPDQPTGDRCTSRPARPRSYESTFAHEYQHLLESYQDPLETTWVNEGLSDLAQTLVGYVDTRKTVSQVGGDSHIYCYQGFGTVEGAANPNPVDCGGPENSLTLWGDQPPAAGILADYGATYAFMTYLYDHYGRGFISALHRDGRHQGLVGVQRALDGYTDGTDVYDVLHDFQVATLVDRYVNRDAGVVSGMSKRRATSSRLYSTVNVGNPAAYARDGAPANGADFVALRASTGLYLKGRDLTRLTFAGAKDLVPAPLRWTSVAYPPDRDGDAALWSGNESSSDATAITQVSVPVDDPELTFAEQHQAEEKFDYAYTVVSTDGGATYKALANANTVDGPLGPGLNGDAEGFATQTFDLKAYAGKTVLLGFRYVSDALTNAGGWWVDDVRVGGTLVSDGTSTTAFRSADQVRPTPVGGWNVRVVGLDASGHRARVKTYEGRSFDLGRDDLLGFRSFPRVVVIVSYDDPTERHQPQAPYTLTAVGVVQPGGGQSPGAAVRARADRF